jgi:hypothetical protein
MGKLSRRLFLSVLSGIPPSLLASRGFANPDSRPPRGQNTDKKGSEEYPSYLKLYRNGALAKKYGLERLD